MRASWKDEHPHEYAIVFITVILILWGVHELLCDCHEIVITDAELIISEPE